jgi:hypothetical protein
MSEIGFVWDDDGDGLLGVRSCMNADVPHINAGFENRFKTLKSNVLK